MSAIHGLNERDTCYHEAYMRMAREARYRPQAPGDGLGNISLSTEELRDPARLYQEAFEYALKFAAEENGLTFCIGCSNFATNRAFVWTIEAARLLASGDDGDRPALKLLEMAAADVRRAVELPK